MLLGTACLVSQVTVLYCNLGSDSAVHISEEVADAGLVVPQVMWWSYLLNLFLGIVILITMLFCIGPLETVLDSDAPYLQLFTNTGSTGVALALTIILFFLIYSGNITALATTSREIWAFSRDKGFPFSRQISKMNQHRHVPDNAVYLTTFLTLILCLINLGSNLAFNIIVSLSLLALLSTYMISIGCVLRKRILGEPLPEHRWDLGRWGLPINAFAVVYSAFAIVFCCFPLTVPVTTLEDANWAPLVWIGVMFLSFGIYIIHGRKKFTAPVIFVEGRKQPGLGLQGTI
jgi:choline transport protein